jgi:hypothetical protein
LAILYIQLITSTVIGSEVAVPARDSHYKKPYYKACAKKINPAAAYVAESKIAMILYMEGVEAAVAVEMLTIQEVVTATRKTIITITKPTISLTYKIRNLQYQNF